MMNDPFQSGLDAGLNSNSCDCKWLVVAEKELKIVAGKDQTQVMFLKSYLSISFKSLSIDLVARIVILY